MCGERDRVKEKRETLAKYLQPYCKYVCGERERERETLRRFIRILMLSSELT